MDPDTPSASWHPAKMPNSQAEMPDSTTLAEQIETEGVADLNHSHERGSASKDDGSHDHTTAQPRSVLDHFHEDDDTETGGWSLSAQDDHNTEEQEGKNTALVDEEPFQAAAGLEGSTATTKAVKHFSTMSFARTAQEVSWNDDEEPDFSLQRTETDPFKFMAPSDRSNSFPVVPDVEPADNGGAVEHPPAQTQVQGILQELEDDEHRPPLDAHLLEDKADAGDQDAAYFEKPIGGDTVASAEATSDNRFEEGVPLIPAETANQDNSESSKPAKTGFEDSFAEEAGEGVDFFSQLQSGSSQGGDRMDLAPTLQRKDTSVYVGNHSKGTSAHSTFDIEQETLDEEDEGLETSENKPAQSEGAQLGTRDLDAKWAAAFAGDDGDDFLLEDGDPSVNEVDAAGFLGSDDEGLLDDDLDGTSQAVQDTANPQTATSRSAQYVPGNLPAQQQSNPYSAQPYSSSTTFNATPTVPPPATGGAKVASFVDKAKTGYSSPYDLDMSMVRQPKKRPNSQQFARSPSTVSAPPAGPPRTVSTQSYAPQSGAPVSSSSPPTSSYSNQGPKSTPQLKTSSSSFFEDLPTSSRPRPASRQSLPSPSQTSQYGIINAPPQAEAQGPPQGLPRASMPQAPVSSPSTQSDGFSTSGGAALVAPERVSPYAQVQSGLPQRPVAAVNNRYSPAPSQPNSSGVPPAAPSRYSPAPAASRSSSGGYSAVPPPALAHQPRTSSPLAHFEVSRDRAQSNMSGQPGSEGAPLARSNSSQYAPGLHRTPTLPPTQEVDEESGSSSLQSPPTIARNATAPPPDSRYSPQKARHTPPPMSAPSAGTPSPSKRSLSNYVPVVPTAGTNHVNFVPPPRAQTQSPTAQPKYQASSKPTGSSASVQSVTSPRAAPTQTSPLVARSRGLSQSINLVPPTDGREKDPLQRWRGAPVISWGVGGSIVTSFPQDIPRYGINSTLPTVTRSPGEVKLKHVKDVLPLEERLAKFPGPLKGKSKKKETIAWLKTGIENLERDLPNIAFQQYVSHEDKRAHERVLLWKVLQVFIEFDGVLEGNPNVDKAVRQVFPAESAGETLEPASAITAGPGVQSGASASGSLRSDVVDASAVEVVRNHLLAGDRTLAVWAAADKRLWGHALLIANTVPGELYKQVTQEFIKKELETSGSQSNESLAALYGVLSGNFEESMDALVPVHARAGMQLLSANATSGPAKDDLAGLEKWKETLSLILSNRSNGDIRALSTLGNLLAGYGRAEAAHVCFLFARHIAVFGGLDDSNAQFVLLGADHKRQADQFGKEIEALLLSEVYEYGMTLSGAPSMAHGFPHLAGYKLQHAMSLAQYGFRDKALQYCEAIMAAIQAQTKRSPYHHHALESGVEDFTKRLKQAPKEESNSWISKPKMDSVSNSMWKKFNNFVAGDEGEASQGGTPAEGAESGPFARLAGGTPAISRSPSVSGFEPYGNPAQAPIVSTTKAGSRYAPAIAQPSTSPYEPSYGSYNPAPRTSMDRSSSEMPRSSYEAPNSNMEAAPMYGGSFAADSNSAATFGYQPVNTAPPQSGSYVPADQGSAPIQIPSQHASSPYSYEPFGAQNSTQTYGGPPATDDQPEAPAPDHSSSFGYQPPSYGGFEAPSASTFEAPLMPASRDDAGGGYEAPSYQPYSFEPSSNQSALDEGGNMADDEMKPKKKSFMDDDEDDIPALKRAPGPSKSDKDRENEEMFRKAAEEDAKRAEAAKGQKKGWFSGGWFAANPKEKPMPGEAPKAVRANLGEASSFVFDPELKRWVNKKAGAEDTPAKSATPPPPRAASRNGNGTPPPPGGPSGSAPPLGGMAPPPMGPPMPRSSSSNLAVSRSADNLPPPGPALGGPPMMARQASQQSNGSVDGGATLAPPPRPSTSLSNASSIDDLLGAGGGPRKAGAKKGRKGGRYVDVMAK